MKKGFIFLFVMVLTGFATVSMAQEVKIGVAASGPESGAHISEVAARAPYFLFFDGQGNFQEALANPNSATSGGAGGDAADLLNTKKVTLFVAGRVGGKMKMALKAYKIEINEQTGVAYDVVTSIIKK